MTFASAQWLVVGLAAALALLAGMLLEDRARRRALASLVTPRLTRELAASRSPARRWVKRLCVLVGTLSLFTALARPRWGFRWEAVKRRGVDVVFAIDTSKSMLARDLAPNRFERAKLAVRDLVATFPDDRVGLVAFAGAAFLQTPLTLDHGAFERSLDAVDVGVIPRSGTDVAAAIDAGREALAKTPDNERLFVLLTDGEDLGGAALAAAERAANDGIRVFTIGVGSPAGELVPVADDEGRVAPLRDAKGELVTSRLDEPLLRQIAEKTGGNYLALATGGASLAWLYGDELARLERAERSEGRRRVPLEQFQWPLALALVLLGVEPFVGEVRRRAGALRKGRSRRLAFAAAGATLLVSSAAFAAPGATPDDPRRPYNEGVAAYRDGHFEDAARAFDDALHTGRLDVQPRAYYNLGNARYRLGEASIEKDRAATIDAWKKAVTSYEAALQLDPNDADARYNLDLVRRRLAELEQQQKDEQKQDQKDQKQDQKGGSQDQQQASQDPKQGSQDQKQASQDPKQASQDQKRASQDQKQASQDQQQASQDQKQASQDQQQASQDQKQASQDQPKDAQDRESEGATGKGLSQEQAGALLDAAAGDLRLLPLPHDGDDAASTETPAGKDW